VACHCILLMSCGVVLLILLITLYLVKASPLGSPKDHLKGYGGAGVKNRVQPPPPPNLLWRRPGPETNPAFSSRTESTGRCMGLSWWEAWQEDCRPTGRSLWASLLSGCGPVVFLIAFRAASISFASTRFHLLLTFSLSSGGRH
jgi:hypothetical protein